jgi:AcrR family transcriptional regulator
MAAKEGGSDASALSDAAGSSGAPGRIRAEQADSSRRRILGAGRKLFAAQGYDGTSVAEIAAQAGVPKGLIFHYYPCKADVLSAIIEEEPAVAQLAHLQVCPVPGDVAATLVGVADAFRKSKGVPAEVRQIIFREASAHPEVRQAMAALHHEAVRVVRNAVDTALGPASTVPETSRDAAAEALVAAGFHERNLRDSAGITIDLTTIAHLIAAGLRSTDS